MESRRSVSPYPPSWVDRLTAIIEALPAPAWATYTGFFLVLVVVANAAAWIDGNLPIGSFDAYLSSLAVYPVVSLAAIPYLDRNSAAALDTMRPALEMEDASVESLRYRLTTLPAGETLVWTIVGCGVAISYVAFGLAMPVGHSGQVQQSVEVAIALIGFPLLAVLFFHTARQLRIISRIQAQLPAINVFQLDPLHAFARVTARNGLILLGLAYVSAATDPTTFANPALIVFMVLSALVAIAAFALPLHGMHQRIVSAKQRLTADVNRDLQVVLAEISRRARAGDLSDADALNKQLASVVTQRDLLARVPTWPWDPTTVRGFATAVVLPIALWLVFRALERFVR